MTMDRRRFLSGAAALAAALGTAGGLTACGGGRLQASPDRLSLFTYLDATQAPLLDQVLDSFRDESGITVRHDTLPGSGAALFPDKVRTQLLGARPPDLFMMWGGQIAAPFIDAGQIAALDEVYARHGWDELLNPAAVRDMTFDGHRYGLPGVIANLGCWYRTDLFERAGVSVPTSYDELEDACDRIVASGVVPLATGGVYGWDPMRLFEYLLEITAGPELHDRLLVGEASWDRAEVRDAFGLFRKWVERKWVPEGFLGITPDVADSYLTQGTGAFLITGQWQEYTNNASGLDPELFGTFVLPTGHDVVRTSGWTEGFFLSRASPNGENAARLFDFLLTPPAQETFAGFRTPLTDLAPDPGELPLNARWLELGRRHPHYVIQDQAFPKDVSDAYFQIQSDIAQDNVSPRDAAARMQDAVTTWKEGQVR